MYAIGKMGTGKTTVLETMILQDIEQDHGCVLLDPPVERPGLAQSMQAPARAKIRCAQQTNLCE
jgi:ABC-type proline/glycine betaine transport system ATPase subunit